MVANIPYPSSNGLTTTCPIDVERNVTSDETSIKISLRFGSTIFPKEGDLVHDSDLEATMQLYMNLAEVVAFLSRARRRSRDIEAALIAVYTVCQQTASDCSNEFRAFSRNLDTDFTENETLFSQNSQDHIATRTED